MKSNFLSPVFLFVFLLMGFALSAQTTIYTNSHTNTNSDGPEQDFSGLIDVSNCSSISFSLTFTFNQPWEGDGNMEYCNEITPSTGNPTCFNNAIPCACNPATPMAGSCYDCWDFLWAQFNLGGSSIVNELIGGSGTDDSDQSGTIASSIVCVGNANSAFANVTTQTWAADESVNYTTTVVCYEGVTAAASTVTACPGEPVTLTASGGGSYQWSDGLGTSSSVMVNPIQTTTYAVTATDANGCSSTADVTVNVQAIDAGSVDIDCNTCNICAGQTAEIYFTLPSGTFDVQYSGGGNTYTASGISSGQAVTVPDPLNNNTTFTIQSVSDGNCTTSSGFTSSVTVVVQGGDPNDVAIDCNTCSVCEGTAPTLTFDLPSGTFDIQYSDGSNTYTASGVSSGQAVMVPSGATSNTTYTITSVTQTGSSCSLTGPFGEDAVSIAVTSLPQADILPISNQCASGSFSPTLSADSDVGGQWIMSFPGVINSNTGEVDLALSGQGNYTITYQVGNAPCSATASESLTIESLPNATISPMSNQCESGTFTAQLQAGSTAGGTWSINNGGVINPSTGEINLASSGQGNYTITYQVGNVPCSATASESLTIESLPNATVIPMSNQCESGSFTAQLQAGSTAGGTWSINNGGVINPSTGEVNLASSGQGNYTITYQVGSAPCSATASESLTIESLPTATISPMSNQCESGSFTAQLQAGSTPGGTWSINNGGVINPSTGEVNLASSGQGNYTITYQVGSAPCSATASESLTIESLPNATVIPMSNQCESGSFTAQLQAGSTPGGTWSINNGGVINPSTGEVNLASSGQGNYTITYQVGSAPCSATASESLTIESLPNATVIPMSNQCESGSFTAQLQAGSTLGGTWSINNGGVINPSTGEVNLASSGQGNYTITYQVGNAPCSATASESLTIESLPNATVIPMPNQCESGTFTAQLQAGSTAGGTWSINNGGVINPSTGEVNLTASGQGNYTITYQVGSAPCSATASESLTIESLPTATISPMSNQCESGTFTTQLQAGSTTGGTWSINNGGVINPSTGEVDLTASGQGNYTITYQVGSAPCSATASESLAIESLPNATISPMSNQCESGTFTAQLQAGSTAGGTWSINNGGVINPSTGEVDLTASGQGNYTITYQVGSAPCSATASESLAIESLPNATISPMSNQCESGTFTAQLQAGSTAGGTWSINNGGVINPSTGEVDLTASGQGNYTITYQVGSAPCSATASESLAIESLPNATISPMSNQCESGTFTAQLQAGSTAGGTWSINNGGVINPSTGEVNLASSGQGNYTITYQVGSAPCSATASESLTIESLPTATISPMSNQCESGSFTAQLQAGSTYS